MSVRTWLCHFHILCLNCWCLAGKWVLIVLVFPQIGQIRTVLFLKQVNSLLDTSAFPALPLQIQRLTWGYYSSKIERIRLGKCAGDGSSNADTEWESLHRGTFTVSIRRTLLRYMKDLLGSNSCMYYVVGTFTIFPLPVEISGCHTFYVLCLKSRNFAHFSIKIMTRLKCFFATDILSHNVLNDH